MLHSYQSKAEERQGRTVRPEEGQEGACRSCRGERVVELCFGPSDRSCAMADCRVCGGTGRAVHLSHSDLAALAAD